MKENDVDREELSSPTEESPKSLDEIVARLLGFGIEENEEILTLKSAGKTVRLRVSNIPTQDEMTALIAAEELKGYAWIQQVKCEILSRAITWIDGVSIRTLPPEKRLVVDPADKVQKDIQVVLRNVILGWGQELKNVLWKILMTHQQRIEDRLVESFPDSALMTDVEKRFMEQALKEVEEATADVIRENVEKIFEDSEAAPTEEKKA